MKSKSSSIKTFFILVFISVLIYSCQKDLGLENDVDPSVSASNLKVSSRNISDGRTLAANCFQCHGTNGNGYEHLAGEAASEIIDELSEMKNKNLRSNIMNVHAAAYTTEEIAMIADFFSKQK